MKLSNAHNSQILRAEDGGHIFGVSLSGDYTAEHENGCNDIHHKFAIRGGDGDFEDYCGKPIGAFPMRTFTVPAVKATKRKEGAPEGFGVTTETYDADYFIGMMNNYGMYDFSSAWDERNFMIAGFTDEGKKAVEVIIEGFKQKDLAVWTGSRGVFGTGGLAIVRPSLTPLDKIQFFNEKQAARRKLDKAAEETGIKERILAKMGGNGQRWNVSIPFYALSPVWISEEKKAESDHPVMFFLNPGDQKNFNYGYFTVEELDQWINGKGPIIKEKAA